jgi:GTP-binding protein Era
MSPMSEDKDRPEAQAGAQCAAAAEPPTGSMTEPRSGETRCGFIAVIGAPNAGKSTLVNKLVGAKVAIVSRKVQTTRTTLRGIALAGASQLVFIDTPGIFAPKRRLDRAMVEAAWGGAGDADLVLLVVDAAKGSDEDVERIVTKLRDIRSPLLLALNKIDRVQKERLLELASDLNARLPFTATFMISALDGNGVADLKAHLAAAVPVGPWHYPEDEITDAPMRILAAEITREKIYDRLHEELPYQTAVETTAWTEQPNGIHVEQTIYVERDSQKRIVVGKGAGMIKQLSMEARKELAALLERPVHLFLFVKVREGWGDDPARYRDLGLVFPKE